MDPSHSKPPAIFSGVGSTGKIKGMRVVSVRAKGHINNPREFFLYGIKIRFDSL